MADNPLFYQSVVPLNREAHRLLKLDQSAQSYAFASKSHVSPAVADEFALACRSLTILFVPGVLAPAPVFLVGLKPGQNVLVDEQGGWRAGYVPAFLRRYPFMLGETPEGGSLACIDEKCDFLSRSSGEPLFGDKGLDSALLQQKIHLINDYYAAAKRTELFAGELQRLNLLQPVTIEAKVPQGASTAMHGLLVVSEGRLNDLPAAELVKLRDQGSLAAIYAHLISLKSVDALRDATFRSAALAAPSAQRAEELSLQ